ncbi:phosphatidylserine decarboxylase Psd2 [Aspergillus luchuensis]|uniref:Phosphatidylserine decarboxylase Psd2 n=1 Tax=Aspergillus kawachii TaxID=1069201 RepID=A0A146FJ96_ASPKA|nr:phosphatidylserine decarboxylase Psd2 [Aspergillus luchuensis]
MEWTKQPSTVSSNLHPAYSIARKFSDVEPATPSAVHCIPPCGSVEVWDAEISLARNPQTSVCLSANRGLSRGNTAYYRILDPGRRPGACPESSETTVPATEAAAVGTPCGRLSLPTALVGRWLHNPPDTGHGSRQTD